MWPTPRILEFGAWVRQEFERQQLAQSVARRGLTDLEERELWRQSVREHAPDEIQADAEALATLARRAFRAMQDYGIPVAALQGHASGEAAFLLRASTAFEQRCRELGALHSQVQRAALHIDDAPAWIESPAWRPEPRRWLRSHAEPALEPDIAPRAAIPAVSAFDDSLAELAAMAEWARARLDDDSAFRAWIYWPQLSSQRADIERAFEAALPDPSTHAIAGGPPLLDRTPVQIALAALEALLGELRFDQFSRLLRARELNAGDEDECRAGVADVLLRQSAPFSAPVDRWIALAERLAQTLDSRPLTALQRLRLMRQQLSAVDGSASLSTWIGQWRRALEAGPWANRASWSSQEFQAAQRFRELMDSLARAEGVYGSLGAEDALRVLRRAARETAFQPQTGVPAIWITGQAVDPWLAYDGIWIGDASLRTWPRPAQPIALLPIALQKQYGVAASSAALQLADARELQARWRARASSLRYSYADEEAGRASNRSVLIAAFSERHDGSSLLPEGAWHAMRGQGVGVEKFIDERGPVLAEHSSRSFKVSSLRAQSLCAFRGFATARLGLEPLRTPSQGFDRMERGMLLHDALQFVWERLKSLQGLTSLDPAARTQVLARSVDRALARRIERRGIDRVWIPRERGRLIKLIDRWLDVEASRPEFAVDELERAHRIDVSGLQFSLRIDRVDRLPDGRQILIDYKSGATKKDWDKDRPENPQLALYARAVRDGLAAVAYAEVSARNRQFRIVADDVSVLGPRARPSMFETAGPLSAELELWQSRIERLARELAAGMAQVDPLKSACGRCHLHAFCRIDASADSESGESID